MERKIRWAQTRKLLLLAIAVAGISGIFIYPYILAPTQSQEEKWLSPKSPPLSGEISTLSEAQALLPFKICLPIKLGSFSQLRLDQETVIFIYGNSTLSDDATITDVINKNGVILFEMTNKMTMQDVSQNIEDAIKATENDIGGGLQLVKINGYLGCAGGNVWHDVSWYTKTTRYELIANIDYPLQQLIEIAQSIPIE